MTADGHTKGSIDRALLVAVMDGAQNFAHDVKRYKPYRPGLTSSTEGWRSS